MSALQLESFLEETHHSEHGTNGQNKCVHLFVYDREYSWTKFQKEFPTAILGGVGWLNGWEWHIQPSGHPNIRPVYGFDERVNGCTPTEQSRQGTFGYIFQVTLEDVETVRTLYRGKRIKLTTTVDAALKYWAKDRLFEVVAFFDPYDTNTIPPEALGKNDIQELQLAWLRGSQELQLLGCPSWYMKNIFTSVLRKVAIPQALRDIYVKPEARMSNLRDGPNPIDELRIRWSELQEKYQQRLLPGVSTDA